MSSNSSLIKSHGYVPINYDTAYLEWRQKSNQQHRVVVAVMDTGIDPGAFGLTRCPDGTPKILDVIDCTGSDDIIVKKYQKLDRRSCPANPDVIENVHKLFSIDTNIFTDSKVDTDKIVSECEFYTGIRSLKSFVSERSIKNFNEKQSKIINNIVLKVLVIVHKKYNAVVVDYDDDPTHWIYLAEFDKVRYFDDEFDPKRKNVPDDPKKKCRYGSIPIDDNLFMNFAFHLYDGVNCDEKICSIVFDTGSHATHVAGIVGGSFDDPQMNGVNPECQFISLKIGDSRVDGMETSIALIRALQEIVKKNCHLVNYSYGEPVGTEKGRFIELLDEYVMRHNIVFVTSAGNSGPAITTVGAPGAISDKTISVGAHVNSEFMKDHYFLTPNGFETGLTEWSSRGPSMLDTMGVDVIASGCALTSHPRWNSSNLRMCNGTSMAAPNATGFVSLVLSQFNNQKEYPHAYWIKRYVELTCNTIGDLDCFCQGHGLIGQRFRGMSFFDDCSTLNYYFDVKVDKEGKTSKKGIVSFVTNEECATSEQNYYNIDVVPNRLCGEYGDKYKSNESFHSIVIKEDKKISSLRTLSEIFMNEPIVKHVDSFVAHQNGRCVKIGIPKHLNISGYLKLYERVSETKSLRYVQSIPINQFVLKEITLTESVKIKAIIEPGSIYREYVYPKHNAIVISFDKGMKPEHSFDITIVQVYPGAGYKDRSIKYNFKPKYFQSNCCNYTVPVIPDTPTEICINSSWQISKKICVEASIRCSNQTVRTKSKHIYELTEKVPIVVEDFNANALFEETKDTDMIVSSIFTKYHPAKAELFNTDARYTFKNGDKMKMLRLTYNLKEHPNCTYYVNTNDRVYDSNICMSACLNGFYKDKRVFFSNYDPKVCESILDRIEIEFMDSDMDRLKTCTNTVMTAYRKPTKPIKKSVSLKKGVNMLDIPHKEISEIKNIYNNDILGIDILGTKFDVIYTTTQTIIDKSQTNTNTKKQKIQLQNRLKKFIKDFIPVKEFLNTICNKSYKNVLSHELHSTDILDASLKEIGETCSSLCHIGTSYDSIGRSQFTELSFDDRVRCEYIGTLYDCDEKEQVLEVCTRFSEQCVTKDKPYYILDLAKSIIENPTDKKSLGEKMEIIDQIDKDSRYWDNFDSSYLLKLRENLAKMVETDDINVLTKKRVLKRKAELMEKTEEDVTFSDIFE